MHYTRSVHDRENQLGFHSLEKVSLHVATVENITDYIIYYR